ncbi:alpha/beta hydrolase [Pantoea sp. At-9b]|uniref:alpha/beta hydrolase n=1 Tax=Pantoea sp. (strain At-9b) TaxID=592316 RepID=UPI0001B3EEC5|nr:alpha/beta hydrolase [Pantoea sp. At-9b]ADU71745.1 acetylesterase [Pantoea sp. At-9b]
MHRRRFLTGLTLGTLVAANTRPAFTAAALSRTLIPLWHGKPPGGGGPTGSLVTSATGAQRQIAVPTLTALTPARANGYAVLIAAGGGYKRIEMGKEAWPAAEWLVARGFTAYVLSYRLPTEGWQAGNVVALQDAQRALRIVRQREQHVSLLGFSAGGHLLGLAATRADFQSYLPEDALDHTPATAERAALIYPIITLEPPYSHTSTQRVLVGPHASVAEDASWSVQNYVRPDSPPFFLVQAEDDPVSNPDNTLIMTRACQQQRVAVEWHRYTRGGHGFGMGRPGTPTMAWPGEYARWLHEWQR